MHTRHPLWLCFCLILESLLQTTPPHHHEHLFFFLIYLFIWFLAVLGLHCSTQAFSSCGERGLLSSCGAQASHRGGLSCCRAHAPGPRASAAVRHWLCCLAACRIILDQGSNLHPLDWQADSYPLYHQGSPPPTLRRNHDKITKDKQRQGSSAQAL